MKKFLNMKARDMTIGQTFKFTILLTVAFTAIYMGILWAIYKIEDIMTMLSDAKNYIKAKFFPKKGKRVADEENGLY